MVGNPNVCPLSVHPSSIMMLLKMVLTFWSANNTVKRQILNLCFSWRCLSTDFLLYKLSDKVNLWCALSLILRLFQYRLIVKYVKVPFILNCNNSAYLRQSLPARENTEYSLRRRKPTSPALFTLFFSPLSSCDGPVIIS